MEVGIADAARRLGQSERQIRYSIKQGKLDARKDGTRWLIKLDASAATEGQQLAQAAKEERARQVVEDVLSRTQGGATESGDRKRFSALDLRLMVEGRALLERMRAELKSDHPAAAHLHECLTLVACGVHEFDEREKAALFRRAREQACRCLMAIVLGSHSQAPSYVETLETAVLPGIGGLMRRAERRRK